MKNLKTYILEGSLLDDIDNILTDGDSIVKSLERKRKLSQLNIPSIDDHNFFYKSSNGISQFWEFPKKIYDYIHPALKQFFSYEVNSSLSKHYKEFILNHVGRLRILISGKSLSISLVNTESVDGITIMVYKSKDANTFGQSLKEKREILITIVEQLALHPEILKEMILNPASNAKEAQNYYNKIMMAE